MLKSNPSRNYGLKFIIRCKTENIYLDFVTRLEFIIYNLKMKISTNYYTMYLYNYKYKF